MWGNKYKNIRVKHAGYSFQSKLEAAVYSILKLREKAQEIEIIQLQAKILLPPADIEYRPDFKIRDLKTDKIIYVEAKGFESPEWRLKLKLYKVVGPAPLELWKGSHNKPILTEIIIPKPLVD